MPQDINPIIDRLIALFPECLSRAAPKPLRIGIGNELIALAGVHPALMDVSRTQVRRAIAVYTNGFVYRKALRAGGPRYGLDGEPAGEVTPEQQAFAKTPRRKALSLPVTSADQLDSAGQPVVPAASIDQAALLQEVIAMAISGKLDVILKVNQLPAAKPSSAQTMLFAVQAEGKTVVVEVKNKVWNTLKAAAENYPQWVAAITGKMGAPVAGGFRLDGPAVQVFEKKAKPESVAAATPAPAPATPVAPVVSAEPAAPAVPAASAPPALDRPKLTLKSRVDK